MANWKKPLAIIFAVSSVALGSTSIYAQIPASPDQEQAVERRVVAGKPTNATGGLEDSKPMSLSESPFANMQVVTGDISQVVYAETHVDPSADEKEDSLTVPQQAVGAAEQFNDLSVPMAEAKQGVGAGAVSVPAATQFERLLPQRDQAVQAARLAEVSDDHLDSVTSRFEATALSAVAPNRAPTVTIHPGDNTTGPNECVVEVLPDQAANGGYKLQLAIPDSVSSIEVMPTNSANRSFRIRMDDNATQMPQTPASKSMLDEQQSEAPTMTTKVAQNEITHAEAAQAEVAKGETLRRGLGGKTAGLKFKENPFFHQTEIATSQKGPVSDIGLEQRVELAGARMPIGKDADAEDSSVLSNEMERANMEPSDSGAQKLPAQPAGVVIPVSVEPLGPATMDPRGTADFTVVLRNQSGTKIENYDLRLSLPEGMHITVLDRPADYDAQFQTVTWRLSDLGAGATETIRYRVQSKLDGRHTQALEVGESGRFGNLTTFSTSTVR